MRLNLATKSGWILSEAYREFKKEGGIATPSEWNSWMRISQDIKMRIRRAV